MSSCHQPARIKFTLDQNERLISYEINAHCKKKSSTRQGVIIQKLRNVPAQEILQFYLDQFLVQPDQNDEALFLLHYEWDILKTALAKYLHVEKDGLESDRCQIILVEHDDGGICVEAVIFPPEVPFNQDRKSSGDHE